MRELFDEIYNSVVNGQHKQAIRQFLEIGSGNERADCLNYFNVHLEQPEITVKLARLICFNCTITQD